MSSRNNPLAPCQVANALSLGADATSDVTGILYQDNIVYQASLTGSPVGVLYVQGSVDYVPGAPNSAAPFNAGNWVNITFANISAADDVIFDLNQIPTPFIRLFYDRTSGTGAMTALVAGKKV
jgi:hypothetical protein